LTLSLYFYSSVWIENIKTYLNGTCVYDRFEMAIMLGAILTFIFFSVYSGMLIHEGCKKYKRNIKTDNKALERDA